MTKQADKLLAWCERYYRPKGSEKFSIVGREWVYDEMLVPALGWKLWPINPDKLCEKCADRAGEYVDWSPSLVRSTRAHRQRSKTCAGLRLMPNMVCLWNMDRGAGKTANMFALLAACLADPELAPLHLSFMATAGSQTDQLIRENLKQPIAADRALSKRFRSVGNRVEVDHGRRGKSFLEFVESSHRSATGRRRDILAFDEARDLLGRVFSAMLPSLRARSRFICPRGHTEIPYDDDVAPKCKVCRAEMFPKIPRVWIPSTSGLEDGGDTDWFDQTVDLRLEDPKGYCHVFKTDQAANPSASKHETDMMTEVFAEVPGLRDYLEVELGNQARRKGDDFISKADVRRASRDLVSMDGSPLECVGFLDTSWSQDKTTLMIAGWDPEVSDPWGTLIPLHWMIWTPALLPGGVIDPTGVQAHLDRVLPLFPSLRAIMVDDRGMQWAKDLVVFCNRERARTWGSKMKLFHGRKRKTATGRIVREGARIPGLFGGEEDRALGWQMLHFRLVHPNEPLVWLPREKIFGEELRGVTKIQKPDGTVEIRDRNRRKRHADVVDALAGCCLLAYLLQVNPSRGWASAKAMEDDATIASFKPVVPDMDPVTFL